MVLPQRSRSVLCFLERCVINPRTPTGFKGKSTFANRLLYYSHTVYEAIISWFNNYLLTRIKLTFLFIFANVKTGNYTGKFIRFYLCVLFLNFASSSDAHNVN